MPHKSEMSLDTGVPKSIPVGFCVFYGPGQEPESKFCENLDPDPESLLFSGSSGNQEFVRSSF